MISYYLWMKNVISNFPIFDSHPDIVYLDNASTVHKPKVVIDAVSQYLQQDYANIHRGTYKLSIKSEEIRWHSRKTVSKFINALDESEVIFTGNSTDSVNVLVRSLLRSRVVWPGDNIILSELEHHANLVSWQMLSEMTWAELRRISVSESWNIDVEEVGNNIDQNTKIIALTACSNVTWYIWLDEIKRVSTDKMNAYLVVDASQLVPHWQIDVQEIWADFLFFTWHKIWALTWIWVLRWKKQLLESLQPWRAGWGAVDLVAKQWTSLLGIPDKFEPWTPNIVWALSLSVAIDYIQTLWTEIHKNQLDLIVFCLEKFKKLEEKWIIKLLWGYDAEKKIWLFSFLPLIHELSEIEKSMNQQNIAIRTWAHCTHIYHAWLSDSISCGVEKSCRMSLWIYTTKQDCERFFEVLENL